MSPERRRILVVDDEPELAMAVSIRLRAEGYETSAVYNGPEGLQRAQRWQPDLIILDVLMPGMDGLEVCRRLKADEATRHIPVLIITAAQEASMASRCAEAGAAQAMPKPFEGSDLMGAVAALLGGGSPERAKE